MIERSIWSRFYICFYNCNCQEKLYSILNTNVPTVKFGPLTLYVTVAKCCSHPSKGVNAPFRFTWLIMKRPFCITKKVSSWARQYKSLTYWPWLLRCLWINELVCDGDFRGTSFFCRIKPQITHWFAQGKCSVPVFFPELLIQPVLHLFSIDWDFCYVDLFYIKMNLRGRLH